MGWKTINGRRYYYRSVREGGRVRTEYYGAGEAAEVGALSHGDHRAWREARRRADRRRREADGRVERALDDLVAAARRAAAEALTAAGYHRHRRGEWRKRRGERHRTAETT